MKRIWKFTQAVIHHWKIFITGGVLIAGVSLWQMTGHYLPPKAGWIIGAIAIVVAFFRAWNEEYQRAESLQRSHEQETLDLPPPPPGFEELDAIPKEEPSHKLTIEAVSVRTTGMVPGNHATLTEWGEGLPTAIIAFKNKPSTVPGQQTESFYGVSANLTYVGADRTEHIDYGNWLDEYTRYVDFKPGETRTLVIATIDRESKSVVGLYNPKKNNPLRGRIRSGMTILHGPDVRMLPIPPCEVTITLVGDNITLLSEDYQLNWTADKKIEIRKIESHTSEGARVQ